MSKLLILIVTLLPVVGMSQTDGDKPIGTWKVDIAETVKLMDTDTKARYEGIQPEAQERARQSMEERFFVFKTNASFEARWKSNGSNKSATGTWILDGDKVTITIENQSTEYIVSTPSTNVLILKNSNGRGLFHDLYLESE